ncbi:MAG: hypothetical protein SO147_08065 [Clostridia bacterium]|nr:hypothetical protein [Clostridia bacterium]
MLQNAVEKTTKSNIYEIAALNRNTMAAYIEIAWEDLNYIGEKIGSYKYKTFQDALERLNLERANSRFESLYLLDENGVVYSDAYVKYAPGDNANYNFQELIGAPSKRFVSREDNILLESEKGIKALTWVQEGIERGWYAPHCENLEILDNLELFTNGQMAIYLYNIAIKSNFDLQANGFVNCPTEDGEGLCTSFLTGFEVFDNDDDAKHAAS